VPWTSVHAPPSTAYWNLTPLEDPRLLPMMSLSSTAPSGANGSPFGSARVTDGFVAGATLDETTAEVVTGALWWPNWSSRTTEYVCEPWPAASSVHESEPYALAATGLSSASFWTRYTAPLAAAG